MGQQSFFKMANQSSECATKASFLIVEALASKGKPLFDDKFLKDCLEMFTAVACPDKKSLVERISLSQQTAARRVDDLAFNIQSNLCRRLDECEIFSVCLDESTGISDTAQLAVYVRGVTKKFIVVEKLLDLCPIDETLQLEVIFWPR